MESGRWRELFFLLPSTLYLPHSPLSLSMDFASAISLIERNNHVGMLLPQSPDHDCVVSAEVIMQYLADRRKHIGLIAPIEAEYISRLPDAKALAVAPLLTREFIVSLDTSQSPVSQLRYDNKEKHIDIILSPKHSPISKEHISFREGNVQCDCIITIGIPDIESIDMQHTAINPSFFSETPIIAIDNSSSHKRYGEINLVDPFFSSIAEITYRFLVQFPDYSISHPHATLLLSGILHRTNGFRTSGNNPQTLLSGHELIQSGADYETAYSLSQSHTPPSLMPLVGRALARSKTDTKKGIVWSLITKEDFLATGRSAVDISPVMAHLEKEFPSVPLRALLWQEINDARVYARLAGLPELLERVKQNAGGEFRSPYLQITDSFTSFIDAENAINSLLEQVL